MEEDAASGLTGVLDGIGPRLKALRLARNATLGEISYATKISISTLSRLESGKRRPNLELLVPIARALKVPLDDIVGKQVNDPRIPWNEQTVGGRTVVTLTREPGNLQTYRITIPQADTIPDPRIHEGYDWLYVLSGKLRLVLGDLDLILAPGEAAEFDTLVPHWMGSTG